MTRIELERHLGKYVEIVLFDGTVIEGILHKTGEKAFLSIPNLSIPKLRYFCACGDKVVSNCVFRLSHIKKISRIKIKLKVVDEVKLSKWVKKKDRKVGEAEAYCLTCGREVVYQVINNRYQFENYCPHCGARMDREEKKMIDCAKTENYFAEKQRMTKEHKLNHGGYACKLNCADCPLSHLNNGSTRLCSDFETLYPEKAIAIVQKWSDEHPQK